jgi:DNA-binding transcriptional MerR regulator
MQDENQVPKKLLTVNEVAALLDVAPSTLRGWKYFRKNLQPSYKVGHQLRYEAEDVRKFLEASRLKTPLDNGAA